MPSAKPKKEKPPPEPDDLLRESAGEYRSGDGRFSVSQSDGNWFVVDTEQANEFGQELIHGPFASLKKAQAAMSGARTVKPLLRSTPRPKRPIKAAPAKRPPSPAPTSWIDRLDEADQKDIRSLIRALGREGLEDAEELVRRHRDDSAPVITTRLIENRLARLVESLPEDERPAARELVSRVAEALTVDGLAVARPARRWALVELGPDDSVPRRAIKIRG